MGNKRIEESIGNMLKKEMKGNGYTLYSQILTALKELYTSWFFYSNHCYKSHSNSKVVGAMNFLEKYVPDAYPKVVALVCEDEEAFSQNYEESLYALTKYCTCSEVSTMAKKLSPTMEDVLDCKGDYSKYLKPKLSEAK